MATNISATIHLLRGVTSVETPLQVHPWLGPLVVLCISLCFPVSGLLHVGPLKNRRLYVVILHYLNRAPFKGLPYLR